MNCKDFESMVHELVSPQAADKATQLEALEHAGQCLWCALRLDDESKVTENLRTFASALEGQRAPVRVEEALLQAFRERTGRKAVPRLGLAWKTLWRRLSWALILAAATATAWIFIVLGTRSHPGSTVPTARAGNHRTPAPSVAAHAKSEQPMAAGHRERPVKNQTESAQSLIAAPQSTERSALIPDQRQSRSRAAVVPPGRTERAAQNASANRVSTDFISLGTCDDSECMDEALVVRVTLPAEALLAFGVATDDDTMEGRVQAEVALGSDGVPFAIRFVD